MKTILKAIDLKVNYQVGKVIVPALRGVYLEVQEGEFVAIMGPSGCGKSTLLHVLGGLLHPTSGRVILDEVDLSQVEDCELTRIRREKIGFVFQRFNLLPTLTAFGNVEMALKINGIRNGTSRSEVLSMLTLVGLKDKLYHRPTELSMGEQQRVAIARALIHRPSLVLADEPTGNLDSANSAAILKLFMDLNKQLGQTIVLITHDWEVASKAHRIIKMRDGQIIND
jgi:putative ABC transport system ATP-binding protein